MFDLWERSDNYIDSIASGKEYIKTLSKSIIKNSTTTADHLGIANPRVKKVMLNRMYANYAFVA